MHATINGEQALHEKEAEDVEIEAHNSDNLVLARYFSVFCGQVHAWIHKLGRDFSQNNSMQAC